MENEMNEPQIGHCIHCMSEEIGIYEENTGLNFYVRCRRCKAQGPHLASPEMAIYAWKNPLGYWRDWETEPAERGETFLHENGKTCVHNKDENAPPEKQYRSKFGKGQPKPKRWQRLVNGFPGYKNENELF